jgi:hypothetical protein
MPDPPMEAERTQDARPSDSSASERAKETRPSDVLASERAKNDALARAVALRQRLQTALKDARASLTQAEETNQRLHEQLERMTASGARRLLVNARQRVRRAAQIVRHPLWTAGTVARGIAATPAPATARRAVDHLVRRAFPLRLAAPG